MRLPSTSSSTLSGSTTRGTQRSSTSTTATRGSGSRPSAAATPAGMFAPVWLLATGVPLARSASASRRVVVVLPFVAETIATRRPAATSSRRSGASASITRPLTCVPAPRPTVREAQPAVRPATSATRARADVMRAARTNTRRRGRESRARCGHACRGAGPGARGPRRALLAAGRAGGPRRGSRP